MSVSQGSPVTSNNVNTAFMSRNTDTDTTGKIDLKNSGSADITDLQQTINDLSDDFDPSTGHDHDGTDSKKVIGTNLDTTGATLDQVLVADGTGGATWEDQSGGAGGGGDADTLHLLRADNLEIADIDLTGNDPSFDGGGTITPGSLTLSTTAADLLTGAVQVIKYAPGADGSGDYFGFTKAIPIGQRGMELGFQINFKNSATTVDNDFRAAVKIKDGANAGFIEYFDMKAFYSSDGNGKVFPYSSFIPSDCTEIELGWQNTSTTTTVSLHVDNILVSQKPFIYKDMVESQSIRYDTGAGWGSTNTAIPYFTNLRENVGDSILTVENSSANGFSLTALKDCDVEINFTFNFASNDSAGFSLNSSQLSTSVYTITAADRLGDQNSIAANNSGNCSYSGKLSAGDVLRPHGAGTTIGQSARWNLTCVATATTEHYVTPMEAGSQIIRYDGYTSGTADIKFKTLQYDLNGYGETSSNELASHDNTGSATRITATKDCYFEVFAGAVFVSVASDLQIRRYDSVGTFIEYASVNDSNSASHQEGVSNSFRMNEGDYIQIRAGAAAFDDPATRFTVKATPLVATALGAVPVQRVAYIDTDAINYSETVSGSTSYVDLTIIGTSGDNIGASVSSNTLSLESGKYILTIPVGAFNTGGWVDLQIYNNDTSTSIEELLRVVYSATTTAIPFTPVHTNLELSTATDIKFRGKSTTATGDMYIGRIQITKIK